MTIPSEPSYREIPLTQGQITIVDAADYDWLMQWKWCAIYAPNVRGYYAVRTDRGYITRMHREILGLKRGDIRRGDHISRNTLDNRQSNLRIANRAENGWNRSKDIDNTSGYKGVSRSKKTGKWIAMITVHQKVIYLGQRDTAEAAHRELYAPAALKYHGEFARTE